MKILKTIRLLFTFYRNLLASSLLINSLCIYLLSRHGLETFNGLCWFKLITLAIVSWFVHSYKSGEYLYYSNLGISKRFLWTSIILFDITVFVLLIIMTYSYL